MSSIKKLVRVFLVDGESKHGLMVEDTITAAQLVEVTANKVHLNDWSHFAIFENRGDEERCLGVEEKPVFISEKWTTSLKTSNDNLIEPKFVFKKKVFLRDEDEFDTVDPVAKHLSYIQTVHSVIEGEYPCSIEDSIALAGLQTQVIYGAHNPANHVSGFFGQNLKNFVPKLLLPLKPAKEWETLIFKNHVKRLGMSSEDAKSEYLATVKQWPFYGTTYFKGCRTISKSKNIPPKLALGINLDGIVLVSNKDKQQTISQHPFTDLLSWNVLQDSFTFEFGTTNDFTKYSFATTHAHAINDLMQSYVDALLQMIKVEIGNATTSPRE